MTSRASRLAPPALLTQFALVALIGVSGCAPRPSAPPDACHADAGPDGDAGDAGVSVDGALVSHRATIADEPAFASLATVEREVKFLVRSESGALPGPLAGADCVFSQTTRFPLHLQFLRSLPGLEAYSSQDYALATQRRATRVYAPGSLYWFPGVTHPDGSLGVMAYTLSVSSDEAPDTVEGWAHYDGALRGCVGFPRSDLVLVGVDPAQDERLVRDRAALAARGVTVMPREALNGNVLEVYSAGETYGYVRTIAPGLRAADYGPRDIVIADAADDEASVVAGWISTFPQSFGSHFNVRMREKHLPNARWSTARESAELRALEGALVRFSVGTSGQLSWTRASLADAECFWRALQPALPTPRSDLTVTELRPFAALSHADRLAYGVKAANLGEIFAALPAPFRADGFAVPFAMYAEHARRSGAQGPIDALLADEGARTSRAAREVRLDAVRRAITRGALAPGLLDAIAARARATYGAAADTMFLRFRSSTNAEDLEQLSGAGLYDSRTGCLADDYDGDTVGPSRCLAPAHRAALEARLADDRAQLAAHPERTWLTALIADLEQDLTEEKPASDALRKVWRSLWNLRAYDEREYYGLDHRAVFMGVAVMPTMVLERSESVAFTNLPSEGAPGGLYRVLSQVGEIGVVRPEVPTAVPEELSFAREGDVATRFTVVRRSSESPDRDLFTEPERAQIAALLIRLHDHCASRVYPSLRPLRLDVELDVTADGTPVFKQVRPYLGE